MAPESAAGASGVASVVGDWNQSPSDLPSSLAWRRRRHWQPRQTPRPRPRPRPARRPRARSPTASGPSPRRSTPPTDPSPPPSPPPSSRRAGTRARRRPTRAPRSRGRKPPTHRCPRPGRRRRAPRQSRGPRPRARRTHLSELRRREDRSPRTLAIATQPNSTSVAATDNTAARRNMPRDCLFWRSTRGSIEDPASRSVPAFGRSPSKGALSAGSDVRIALRQPRPLSPRARNKPTTLVFGPSFGARTV